MTPILSVHPRDDREKFLKVHGGSGKSATSAICPFF
nr:MAG TPA: AAA domain protein [Caudoviricetes sp.]